MGLKNIKIDEDIWWELNKLKVEWKMKRISDTVRKIIKQRGKSQH